MPIFTIALHQIVVIKNKYSIIGEQKMDKKEITENKENVVIDDFDFSMIADFFKRVDRQGPGGDAG